MSSLSPNFAPLLEKRYQMLYIDSIINNWYTTKRFQRPDVVLCNICVTRIPHCKNCEGTVIHPIPFSEVQHYE